MFNKIKQYLQTQKEQREKREQLAKAQSYYRLVKAGNAFIAFIREDLKRNQTELNRHIRRRLIKEIDEKGLLSDELVAYYAQKFDFVLGNIHRMLNPPKQSKGYNPEPPNSTRPNRPTPPPPIVKRG